MTLTIYTVYVLVVASVFPRIKTAKPEWEMRAELTAGAVGLAVTLLVVAAVGPYVDAPPELVHGWPEEYA